MRDRRAGDAGFTLIEVIVVLVILALSIGILASRGPPRSASLDARGAARLVEGGLRLARSEAIAGNRDVAFTLDVAQHRFRIGQRAWQALPGTLALKMDAVAERGPADAGRIIFAPDGGSSGGRVRLAGGAVALVVGVDWLSGRVTVADGT